MKDHANERRVEPRKDDPESVREWAVKLLRQIGDSRIDISRLNNTDYLQRMSAFQTSRVKKVTYGKEGQIISVDLHDIVNTVEAAAAIAGTRDMVKENAKQRKKEEDEEKNRKARSEKLTLDIVAAPGKQDKKNDTAESPKEESLTAMLGNILS